MICKECGAYNPDHAEFCKVCAASLKGKPADSEPVAEPEEKPVDRFRRRPSWLSDPEPVAEEAKETVEEATEAVAEDAAEAEEQVENAAEEAVPAESAEEPEEPAEQLWTPVKSRRRASEAKEETEDAEPEEETEGIYNDEEALEEEDDSFEYEPTPPKRRQQKKKNNSLFTILLIAIIVVIVGILVLGGYMLLKNQLNCGKSPDRNGSSQTGAQTTDDPNVTQPTEVPSSPDEKTAQLQEIIDENNKEWISISSIVPAHSTLTIYLPHQDDYVFVNEDDKPITKKVRVQVEAFYPDQPLEDTTVEFRPDITIKSPDGSTYKVDCASFTRTFPKLSITITAPIPEGDEPVMAPESNEIHIQGMIDDPSAKITVDGKEVAIYQGGVFMYDYRFPSDATEDTEATIQIVAQNNNCVSDTKEIKVHAYKFIPEPMKLEVRNNGSALRADKNGKLTVTGTTLPGATLTAVSDNSTNVRCGSVNVDAEGNFSFQISMVEDFYGMSTIKLDAVKEGAENGSTEFVVLRGFADKEAFVKHYLKTKTYLEITPKKTQIADLLANQAQYATNAYGFRISASVVEVSTTDDGDTIVKMTILKTNETVYVHNLSEKWSPAENIGSKYNVYGNFIGTYADTGCCEFYGWFAKKP